MAYGEEDDEEDLFGDDLDEESLLVLEQAEKQHAASITASQSQQHVHHLPQASNGRSTSVPVIPVQYRQQATQRNVTPAVPSSQPNYRQVHQLPSSQQRSTTVPPSRTAAVPPLASQQQPRQQQQQQQQQSFKAPPPPVKIYPPSNYYNANATAGPSRYGGIRQPVRPVYKDDFPDVEIDENGKGYRARGSTAAPRMSNAVGTGTNGHAERAAIDVEKEDLKKKLADLQKSLQEERNTRQAKEGEVKILRQKSEKASKDYEAQLQSELSKIGPLQERIQNLEAMLSRESSKHSSELIFQKQEIESKYRNVAANVAQLKSARKAQHQHQHQQSSQMPRNLSSSQVQSPRKQYKSVQSFQNSFAEPMSSTQLRGDGARLPSSPSDGRAAPIPHVSSPRNKDKGKQREVLDPSSELDYNDIPDIQENVYDMALDDEENEQEVVSAATTSARDEITAFLFDHMPHDASRTSTTLFSLVNPDFSQPSDPPRTQAHREICQKMFHCFGHRPDPSDHDARQDIRFLRDILLVILDFIDFFSLYESSRDEAVLALDLVQDLCQRFDHLAFPVDSDQSEYEEFIARIFKTIAGCIENEAGRLKVLETLPPPPPQNTVIRSRYAPPPPRSRQARNEAEKVRFEREVEPLLCSLLHLLQLLALRPDPTRMSSIDTFVRGSTCPLPFCMDARRRPAVHLESLFLVALLTSQTPLFRSLLAIQLPGEATGNAVPLDTTVANRPQQHVFVEQTASFLSYRIGDAAQSQASHQLSLIALSNLVAAHADGTPLLSHSPSLVQRLVVRIAQDASQLYDNATSPPETVNLAVLIRTIDASMRLLYHLVLSQDKLKGLSAHLSERPFGRDYFVAGVGRIACTEVPEWIQEPVLASQLDQLANLGFELLEDVLSPDEVDDLYLLCRDEDEVEELEANNVGPQYADRNEEEEMAAQNVDAMES